MILLLRLDSDLSRDGLVALALLVWGNLATARNFRLLIQSEMEGNDPLTQT